jgi:hypothetical protein
VRIVKFSKDRIYLIENKSGDDTKIPVLTSDKKLFFFTQKGTPHILRFDFDTQSLFLLPLQGRPVEGTGIESGTAAFGI